MFETDPETNRELLQIYREISGKNSTIEPQTSGLYPTIQPYFLSPLEIQHLPLSTLDMDETFHTSSPPEIESVEKGYDLGILIPQILSQLPEDQAESIRRFLRDDESSCYVVIAKDFGIDTDTARKLKRKAIKNIRRSRILKELRHYL